MHYMYMQLTTKRKQQRSTDKDISSKFKTFHLSVRLFELSHKDLP